MNIKQAKQKIRRLQNKLSDMSEDEFESAYGDDVYEEMMKYKEKLRDLEYAKEEEKREKLELDSVAGWR